MPWFSTAFIGVAMWWLLVWIPTSVVRGIEEGASFWSQLPYVIIALVNLVAIVAWDRKLGKEMTGRILGRQLWQGPKSDRDFVLYLRMFPVDKLLFGHDRAGGANLLTTLASLFSISPPRHLSDTWERRLVHVFERFGFVWAVGDPDEEFPLPGAARKYLNKEGGVWKGEVSEMMRRARLVVIVAAAGEDSRAGEGTLWEYFEAVRSVQPSQIVLVSCAGRDAYERFRIRASDYYRRRAAELEASGETVPPAPELPAWPDPSRLHKTSKGFAFNGVVSFADDWTAQFVHFDTTVERGPTSHARWRRTQRHQIKPWADAFEQRLPGQAVRGTARPHLQFFVFGLLCLGYMGYWLTDAWREGTLWQPTGFVLTTFFIVRTLIHMGSAVAEPLTDVRLPDEMKRDLLAPSNAGVRHPRSRGHVLKYVVRWPGRAGLKLGVMRVYLDDSKDPIPPPRGLSRFRTREIKASPRMTSHVMGGLVVQGQVLDLIERHSDITSRQFAARLCFKFISLTLSVVIFAVIMGLGAAGVPPFDQLQQTTSQIAISVAAFLLLMTHEGIRLRSDFRMFNERRLLPRVPTDLSQEPFVLYLRPHPNDAVPSSAWTGPLDLDLKRLFSDGMRLFRVGHLPQTTPTPKLERLPLPQDGWQERLTEALPYADMVVVPATGTAPATLWQFTEAVRLLPPERLLLLVPSGRNADKEYARFRAAAGQALAERRAALAEDERATIADITLPPELPARPSPGREPALRAAISFDDRWTAHMLPFHELAASFAEIPRDAQLQRIMQELDPILRRPASMIVSGSLSQPISGEH